MVDMLSVSIRFRLFPSFLHTESICSVHLKLQSKLTSKKTVFFLEVTTVLHRVKIRG
ncbi:unnamed protein product [Acanthoscelides obtectus]|uniref:Uncharacterized protein n=1 Tax=Acanthoscelides obtectus TaxID=200917 RepID=A0A9P0NSS0_ACAOB|nr:unnamed protein product [Acanthoscelides obtectus]CAK1666984.1 hypothetical protein AOBTE_LOCUS25597 [Acanthoscelides obtectus]